MTYWQRFLLFKNWLKGLASEFGLETLLFFIALGNASVLHQYLLDTGSADSWQLIIAIYSTELLIVWSSLWKTIGMVISTVLFLVSMISIKSVFGEHWFGHSGFSLAIYAGSWGNYVRRNAWQELIVAYRFYTKKAVVMVGNVIDLAGLTTAEIRNKLGISLNHANIIKSMRDSGVAITDDLVNKTRC